MAPPDPGGGPGGSLEHGHVILGAADGSLIIREDVVDQAEVTWNAVAWTYTHLRGRHRWGAGRARRLIFDLLMSGLGGEAKE